jgi:hypothetical protein
MEQLNDGTFDWMIRKHILSCPPTSQHYHYYNSINIKDDLPVLEEMINHYKKLIVQAVIDPIKEEIAELESILIRHGIIEK